MQGFKPNHARKYADGGLVQSAKRLFGMDEQRNAAVREYRERAAQEKAAAASAAAASAPQPAQKAITDYSSGAAMKRREEAAGLANGGMVRGPGTGTSDDIPDELPEGSYVMPADSTEAIGPEAIEEMAEGEARGFKPGGGKKVPVQLSNGEYKLPPEKVHAIGTAVLDQMKNATHTPVEPRGFAPGQMGGDQEPSEPRIFLVNGGPVSPEEQERLRRQTEMYIQGAQASVPTAPPAAPITKPPAAAPAPAAPGTFDGTRAVISGAADDARAAWNAGNTSTAAGAAVRGMLTAPAVAMGEAAYGAVAPVARAAQGFYSGLTGDTKPAAPAAPATPSTASTIAPTATTVPTPGTAANPTTQRLPDGTQVAQVTQPEPQPMGDRVADQAKSTAQATQVAPGIYRVGNSFGDSPAAAAGFAQPGAQPSEQNMRAADNLAATSARGFTPGGPALPQPAGVAAPVVPNSANDWQARNDLRNLQVSASSITNNGGRFDGTGGRNPAADAYRAGLAADSAARGAQATGDVAAMNANAALQREQVQQDGGLAREQVQQAGANSRANLGFQVDRERLGIDRTRASSENSARDVATQGAQQIQQLRNVLLDPKATPEQRKQAETSLRAIGGKADPANRFTVVPGGQEVSPQGVAYTRPSQVLDNQTGQFVTQGAKPALPPLAENPAALAIKNNTALSKEQKAEALRKMGY